LKFFITKTNDLSFLQLESNSRLVLTDWGGVQEETCIFWVPCVTLRDNTERPETVEVGSNMLAGINPDKILEITQIMLNKKINGQILSEMEKQQKNYALY